MCRARADKSALIASRIRRWNDWNLQEDLADLELDQIDKQIDAARVRHDVRQRGARQLGMPCGSDRWR
jgi:hypothetical protein